MVYTKTMNRLNQIVTPSVACVQFNKTDLVLGKGTYGIVYQKVLQSSFNENENVAVKRIQVIDIDPIREEEKELLEIESMKKFDHQNVLKLHCALEDRDFKYLVLELCNATISDYCEGNYKFPDGYKLNDVDALHQMASGVDYIHSEGFVHRDIKSNNVLIKVKEGDPMTILFKISDFGYCKPATSSGSFSFGKSGVKTNNVTTAPELLKVYADGKETSGNNRATKTCDIFSLGCVFYTFLTRGFPLFHRPEDDRFAVPSNILANRYSFAKLKDEHKFVEKIIEGMVDPNPNNRTSLATVIQKLNQNQFRNGNSS